MSSILYDTPGPRSRRRNLLLSVVFGLALVGLAWFVYVKFDEKGQWAAEKWEPLTRGDVWRNIIIPGLEGTIKAALAAGVLALIIGTLLGLGRMSDHWWIRTPAGAIVELFRAIPLLVLIFFFFFGAFALTGQSISAFAAVILGLTLYNGAVIAEIVRAGVLAVPRGQAEAAYALGLRKADVLRLIQLPQAIRFMLPVLVAQLVVLLKDTALGYIIGYVELLRQANQIGTEFNNIVQASILIAAIYIVINLTLGWFAHRLEARMGRMGRRAPTLGPAAEMGGGG
ncbi:MAG TPA: amino acid ABC transporter permease, partial [Actinoplanes sp.]|nr:amino acid ABC transporter permease [Actinoplanes sp.]